MTAVALLLDVLACGGAFVGAFWLRFNLGVFPQMPPQNFELYSRFSLLVGVVTAVFCYAIGGYGRGWLVVGVDQVADATKAVGLATVLIVVVTFAFRGVLTGKQTDLFSRLIIAMYPPLAVLAMVTWRVLIGKGVQPLRKSGWGATRVLLVGASTGGVRLVQAMQHRPRLGFQVVGILLDGARLEGMEGNELAQLGAVRDLPAVLRDYRVDEVVCALQQPSADDMVSFMRACERAGVRFRVVPDTTSLLAAPVDVEEIAGFPVFSPREQLLRRWNRQTKRALDIVVAASALTIMLPFGLAVALLIRLTSRGPVFFLQERVGRNERVFRMCKFRSMYIDAEERLEKLHMQSSKGDDPLLRLREDPRVTPIGRLLRRYSIDELPQLINVLLSDMSLVGPRPHMPSEVAHYSPWHKRKFDVLPGITGLVQIRGRKDLSLDDMINLDIYYIENWSVWLDLKVLLQTIPIVIRGQGAY